MKITGIQTFIVDGQWWNWVFAKVTTDAGLHGWGEAPLAWKEHTAAIAISELGAVLLGEDPRHIEANLQLLHRGEYGGTGPVYNTAISALEQACWDIKGKDVGLPVHALLGGPCRDRIRVYANGWFEGASTPDEFARAAQAVVAQGYTALKWDPFTSWITASNQEIEEAAASVAAVREAVGDDIDLCVEVHGRLNVTSAIAAAEALRPYRPFFYEEPLRPDNPAAYAKLAQAQIGMPIAAGERFFTRWGFREYIEQQLLDIIQPDISHTGGILEAKKIAAWAETYDIPVAPHNPYGPVAMAATLQAVGCIPNVLILESFLFGCPWRQDIVVDSLECVQPDGTLRIPDAPGLGIELNEEALLKHPYRPIPTPWSRPTVDTWGGTIFNDPTVAHDKE